MQNKGRERGREGAKKEGREETEEGLISVAQDRNLHYNLSLSSVPGEPGGQPALRRCMSWYRALKRLLLECWLQP